MVDGRDTCGCEGDVSVRVVRWFGGSERDTFRLPWGTPELGAFGTRRIGGLPRTTVLGKMVGHLAVNARLVFPMRTKAVKMIISSAVATLEPLPRVLLPAEVCLVLATGRMRSDVATVASNARGKSVIGHVVQLGKSL
jgi:hypothetical protein